MAKKAKSRKAKKATGKDMARMGKDIAKLNSKGRKTATKRQTAAGRNVVSSRRGPVAGAKFGNTRVRTRASGITVAARG